MRAKDVMSDGVVSLSDNATVYEAAELLVSTGVRCHARARQERLRRSGS